MDIDILIGMTGSFEIKAYYSSVVLFVWLFFICPHTDLVTVPPSPSINYSLQQEDTVSVIKKFQHILGLYSSS